MTWNRRPRPGFGLPVDAATLEAAYKRLQMPNWISFCHSEALISREDLPQSYCVNTGGTAL